MAVIAWILKNPLSAGLAGLCLGLSVYAGAQKFQITRLNSQVVSLQAEVVDCNTALSTQNAAVEALGKELEHTARRAEDAEKRNTERLNDAGARIELGMALPEAKNCEQAVMRLFQQIRGEQWGQ